MHKSIELLMLNELAVDIVVICAALRPCCRLRIGRIALAGAIGALISGFSALFSLSSTMLLFSGICFAPLIVNIASGFTDLRRLTGASAYLLASSMLITALSRIFPCIHFTISLGALIAGCTLGRVRRWPENWNAEVYIIHSGKRVSFTALIDTGNRLTEPLSGLPVMVAEESLLKRLLPGNFKDKNSLPRGFRSLSYGALSGNGTLRCFMPDSMKISIDGRQHDAGHIWLAVYPGKIPGCQRALAPAAAANLK